MSDVLRLGIAGLGTVGVGVVRLLAARGGELAQNGGRRIEITAVCARDRNKDRGIAIDSYEWYDDPVTLAREARIDMLVELIGGEEGPARAATEAALARGIDVVTANKALLAHHGTELAHLAEANGANLGFEAAIAGGIPIVKAMRESLAGNAIARVYGILNGTCNYILTKMEQEGRDFADVLAEAQELGYAEADPSFDVGGHDAAHKLALLACLAFGREVNFDAVYIEGIEAITSDDIAAAAELGYRIKLLGVAQATGGGVEARVHPTLVPRGSAIAEVSGVFNAVVVEGDFVGEVMLFGRGAGEGPTASAVVGDIVDIARGCQVAPFGRKAGALKPYVRAPMRAHEGGYFTRLSVYDRPGAIASIAQRMADQNISIASIIQRNRDKAARHARPEDAPPAAVTLVTHETTEEAMRTALAAIERDGHIAGPPQTIRIEPT
ncbi:Homoserine dehydrogenase [hydrothermal vent metagenome]|uniref:Homoserine dehydrogenase n=1 Tax=hydrothermal vent metagenome TaxID=652676 RepID=A0A3B0TR29_9ZZZZ